MKNANFFVGDIFAQKLSWEEEDLRRQILGSRNKILKVNKEHSNLLDPEVDAMNKL